MILFLTMLLCTLIFGSVATQTFKLISIEISGNSMLSSDKEVKLKKTGKKTKGAHNSGTLTGIYETDDDGGLPLKYLIKKSANSTEALNDVVASTLYNFMNPNGGALDFLAVPVSNNNRKDNDVYIASEMENEYTDVSNRGFTNKLLGFLGWNYLEISAFQKILENDTFHASYLEMLAASLAIGDLSLHSENIGVIRSTSSFFRVDFGAAFRKVSICGKVSNYGIGNQNYFTTIHLPILKTLKKVGALMNKLAEKSEPLQNINIQDLQLNDFIKDRSTSIVYYRKKALDNIEEALKCLSKHGGVRLLETE